ncbi:MAG: DNA polymerase III subunit epsilon [Bradyrhizobiaceae bacterium]|nr:DNA polymerase III subunit epsilon [Bradyrhizobiaceae bacterium]
MREIVLDTETTGLDPYQGHRIVEIGCVEIVNRIPSGAIYHAYVNPERDMPAEAEAVHGLTAAFLADKPLFADVVDDFVSFVGDATLVIHNAGFDLAFLNAEFDRIKRPAFPRERAVDTLTLARRRHPGGPNRLDDLCARYGIDNSRRTKHGALLDAELLAEVYAELVGGRQARLGLIAEAVAVRAVVNGVRMRPAPLPSLLSAAEAAAHRQFIAGLGADALWRGYLADEADPAAKS